MPAPRYFTWRASALAAFDELIAQGAGDIRVGGRLLEDLLVAALQRALALAEIAYDPPPWRSAEDLDLDVPWTWSTMSFST